MPDNPHIPALLEALQGPAQTETLPWVGRKILRELGLVAFDEPAS